MNSTAVIYARISRQDENLNSDNSISINNQIQLLLNYSKMHQLSITKLYVDDGFSGADYNRPNYNKLLIDIKKGKIQTILVKDFSRLGRVFSKVYTFIFETLPKYNVRLISVADEFDSFNKTDDSYVTIKAFLNEFYLKEFKKKLKTVKDFNAKTKHLNYYPKYGYIFDEKKREIIDIYSAFIVNKIFKLVSNGISVKNVADILNQNNILTRSTYQTMVLKLKPLHKKPAKKWTQNMVYEIVTDIEYLGHSVNLKRSKANLIVIKNTHNKIVSDNLFEKANTALKITYKNKNKLNHLGKILIDKSSNKNLLFSKTQNEYYLRINGKKIYFLKCEIVRFVIVFELKKVVEKAILNYIKIKNDRFYTKLQEEKSCFDKILFNLVEKRFKNEINEEVFISKTAEITDKIEVLTTKKPIINERLKSVALSNAFYTDKVIKKLIKYIDISYENNKFFIKLNLNY